MPRQNPSLGTDCPIDVDKLIESKLLIQANSGAGKSWAIRRLAEQTYGHAQQIIIDPDGEYYTLREKFDFVLARKGGEAPVDIKSAALLARRLLELNVSAVVDIYELGTQRAEFVKRFLDALVNAPRDLWHSCLVILDEAHMFCPEVGSAVSSDAVKNLMALGRKRGFAGVLATQRIAKLSKDAAAETNNKLIGRSALDVDMKRAADELGFAAKEDRQGLRKLQSGQFYAFGPAISDEVRLIKVGPVQTTHLRAGQRTAPATPPRERVKKVLAQLADLPHEADEEAKSINELRAQVKQLKGELTRARAAQPKTETKTEIKTVEKPMVKAADLKRLEALLKRAEVAGGGFLALDKKFYTMLESFGTTVGNWHSALSALTLAVQVARNPTPSKANPIVLPVKRPTKPPKGFTLKHLPQPLPKTSPPKPTNGHTNGEIKIPKGEAAVLRAAIQFTDGLYKKQLTVLTSYKRSTRDAYIQRLREKGLLVEQGDKIFATDEGRAAMPNAEPLPTGEALRDFWYRELPSGECQILKMLVEVYPEGVQKPTIDEVTGFKRSTRDAYLLRLGAKELVVEVGHAEVQASPTLFEVDG